MNNKKYFTEVFEYKKITKDNLKNLVMENIKTTEEERIEAKKIKQKSSKFFYGIISLSASVLIISFVFFNYFKPHKNLNTNIDDNSQLEIAYEIFRNTDYVATSIDDLYEKSDLVFIGSKNRDNKTYVGINGLIITESNFNVKEIIKGNYYDDSISINYYGGTLTLDEYINNLSEEQIQKKGLNEIDMEIRKTKLAGYPLLKTSVLIENNTTEYMIFVNYNQENNMYFVMSDAYGVRKINEVGKVYNLDTKMFETTMFDK